MDSRYILTRLISFGLIISPVTAIPAVYSATSLLTSGV
ncbi:Uncharacterised protein [Budvicia aquatica]|uniref:Uncharacterized protein n=1 Tax=Budvicia aquatica TaxID=82979 RepID=A0A484ZHJ9_9GAMM|nr:Uncharacterised protein [Budvicia aquatica]